MMKLTKTEISEILKLLADKYPDAHCELNFNNPFELLIATILSAQSTDKRVNIVTKNLFKKYKSPNDFLKLKQSDLEKEIKEIGLYRNKAKNILSACRIIVKEFDGIIPDSREKLMVLPGVGRKTANVVASNAFNIPTIPVDTHVFRVSNRIGLTNSNNTKQVESDLMDKIPKETWIQAHHWLIWHGRRICIARKPNCPICPIKDLCLYYIKSN